MSVISRILCSTSSHASEPTSTHIAIVHSMNVSWNAIWQNKNNNSQRRQQQQQKGAKYKCMNNCNRNLCCAFLYLPPRLPSTSKHDEFVRCSVTVARIIWNNTNMNHKNGEKSSRFSSCSIRPFCSVSVVHAWYSSHTCPNIRISARIRARIAWRSIEIVENKKPVRQLCVRHVSICRRCRQNRPTQMENELVEPQLHAVCDEDSAFSCIDSFVKH